MPVALVIVGLIMVVTGVKDTHNQFGAQLKADFTGPGNFTYWLAAIGVIGAVGYVKPLQPFSNAFLVLVLLVFILKNGSVFDNLKSALAQGPIATPAQAPPDIPEAQKESSNDTENAIGLAKTAAQFAMFL